MDTKRIRQRYTGVTKSEAIIFLVNGLKYKMNDRELVQQLVLNKLDRGPDSMGFHMAAASNVADRVIALRRRKKI